MNKWMNSDDPEPLVNQMDTTAEQENRQLEMIFPKNMIMVSKANHKQNIF